MLNPYMEMKIWILEKKKIIEKSSEILAPLSSALDIHVQKSKITFEKYMKWQISFHLAPKLIHVY